MKEQQQQHKSGVFWEELGKAPAAPRDSKVSAPLLEVELAFGRSLWISLPKNHKENNKEGKQLRGLGFLGGDEANLRKTF